MKFEILPIAQYGRIPAITIGRVSIVWSWPRGKMAWYFWNWNNGYRLGPVTVSIYD